MAIIFCIAWLLSLLLKAGKVTVIDVLGLEKLQLALICEKEEETTTICAMAQQMANPIGVCSGAGTAEGDKSALPLKSKDLAAEPTDTASAEQELGDTKTEIISDMPGNSLQACHLWLTGDLQSTPGIIQCFCHHWLTLMTQPKNGTLQHRHHMGRGLSDVKSLYANVYANHLGKVYYPAG